MNAPNPKPASVTLTPTHVALLEQLVEATSLRTGESPESVRRAVEIAVVTRGIAALQADIRERERALDEVGL